MAKNTVRFTLVFTPIRVILRFTRAKASISRPSWAKALTTRIPVRVSAVRSVRFDQVSLQRVNSSRIRFQNRMPQTRMKGTGTRA